jgi:hypothetical protein
MGRSENDVSPSPTKGKQSWNIPRATKQRFFTIDL